jgi:Outer membrane lipoprotein-sorting protein
MCEAALFTRRELTPSWRNALRGILFCGWVGMGSSVTAETPAEILRRSDVSLLAPDSFQASLTVTSKQATTRLRVWRAGDSNLLVEFLAPQERGKFLLRRGGALYFIAPRAKHPVRLNPAYRLSGVASLDEILGTRYAKEYTAAGATAEGNGDQIALHLEAIDRKARYPTVLYVVDKASYRPTRVEFHLQGGKTARVVEFLRWEEHPRLHPALLRIKDALNPQGSAEVEILRVRPQPVPEALFELADDQERRRLDDQDHESSGPEH